MFLGLARRNADTFPWIAYADELLAHLSIALSGPIAVQGFFVFEMRSLGTWARWLGAVTALLSPGVGIAVAVLLRQMRRRAWSPYDTLHLAVVATACLGWFCAQVSLSHVDNEQPSSALSQRSEAHSWL